MKFREERKWFFDDTEYKIGDLVTIQIGSVSISEPADFISGRIIEIQGDQKNNSLRIVLDLSKQYESKIDFVYVHKIVNIGHMAVAKGCVGLE